MFILDKIIVNIIEKTLMLTSYKWRQARPRDLRALSRAVPLPQLKSKAGLAAAAARRGGG